ncbi:MAG TPA: hypothetical protein VGQ69_07830 [Gemmatimonadales bacterium]|jgi:hypothetical protein|nr:hypothetical protein [Gemmatimonadales bacterium]
MKAGRVRTWILLILGPLLVGAVVLLLPVLPRLDMVRQKVSPTEDSVLVRAGERYAAGPVQRIFLGRHWRDLWTQPVRIEVLKLREFAGGLLPLREGGGLETRSLHFISRSGRRFIFRSTDKELVRLIHYGLGRSLLSRLVQDQTSASHPASPLVAAPLQAAVGLPFPHPRLVVLPPDPGLGVYQERFAGLLGTLQEGPAEMIAVPAGGGLPDVEDTDEVLPRLDSLAIHQVDACGFLTARLLDLWLNDWDRHARQWRWVAVPQSWGTLWRPIPVDRDQAFARYDGLLLALARLRTTKLSVFGPHYPHLQGLTRNSGWLDRRLLAGLSRATWDSVTGFLVSRLSDSVIDAAVRQMPDAYWQLSGPPIASALKQRREGLRPIANDFYAELARRPEVHLAAAGTLARLTYLPDGSVELVLGPDTEGIEPTSWLVRRFLPGETERIDLHAHGAIPRIIVSGSQPGEPRIEVRLFDAAGNELPLPRPGPAYVSK